MELQELVVVGEPGLSAARRERERGAERDWYVENVRGIWWERETTARRRGRHRVVCNILG